MKLKKIHAMTIRIYKMTLLEIARIYKAPDDIDVDTLYYIFGGEEQISVRVSYSLVIHRSNCRTTAIYFL